MREFMTENRQEKAGCHNQAQKPGSCWCNWWQAHVADLNKMALQVSVDQPHAKRHYNKPTIIYSHRNAVDASDCNSFLVEFTKLHGHLWDESLNRFGSILQLLNLEFHR